MPRTVVKLAAQLYLTALALPALLYWPTVVLLSPAILLTLTQTAMPAMVVKLAAQLCPTALAQLVVAQYTQ